MYDNLKDFGRNTGEDGKIFLSKAKKPCETEADGRSETDADYTFKDNYYKDDKGVTKVKRTKFFGFRVHILGDTNYELPIEYTVTKASVGERSQLKKHLEMLPTELTEKIKTLSADKGYDGKETIETVKQYDIKPIIDIKNNWKDGETTEQYKNTNWIYVKFLDTI